MIRIGQQKVCTIYILTTDYSYDQVSQAAAAREMIAIIAVIAAYTNLYYIACEIDLDCAMDE